MLNYQIKKTIGAYIAAMGGVDAIEMCIRDSLYTSVLESLSSIITKNSTFIKLLPTNVENIHPFLIIL